MLRIRLVSRYWAGRHREPTSRISGLPAGPLGCFTPAWHEYIACVLEAGKFDIGLFRRDYAGKTLREHLRD